MAASPKNLFRGAATVTLTDILYTVPAATTSVVTSIVVANTNDTDTFAFTFYFGGTLLFDAINISPNSTQVIDLKQVLTATQTIQGGATNTDVNFSIGGIEVA